MLEDRNLWHLPKNSAHLQAVCVPLQIPRRVQMCRRTVRTDLQQRICSGSLRSASERKKVCLHRPRKVVGSQILLSSIKRHGIKPVGVLLSLREKWWSWWWERWRWWGRQTCSKNVIHYCHRLSSAFHFWIFHLTTDTCHVWLFQNLLRSTSKSPSDHLGRWCSQGGGGWWIREIFLISPEGASNLNARRVPSWQQERPKERRMNQRRMSST